MTTLPYTVEIDMDARPEAFTADEWIAIELTAKLAGYIRKLCLPKLAVNAVAYERDWDEAAIHIHNLQHMVMANVTARQHPEHFRQLGRMFEK